MGAVKRNLIPETYSCVNYLDVEECHECMYAMQTQHIKEEYKPSLEKWYNSKARSKKWQTKK